MSRSLLFMLFVLISADLCADSIRCGRKLVKHGDTGGTLVKKCGEPVRKYSSKENFDKQGREIRATVSNWVYKRTRKRDMIISVHEGRVVKIRAE